MSFFCFSVSQWLGTMSTLVDIKNVSVSGSPQTLLHINIYEQLLIFLAFMYCHVFFQYASKILQRIANEPVDMVHTDKVTCL